MKIFFRGKIVRVKGDHITAKEAQVLRDFWRVEEVRWSDEEPNDKFLAGRHVEFWDSILKELETEHG